MNGLATERYQRHGTARTLGRGARLVLYALLLVALLGLGGQVWQRNLSEACWREEWPRLPSCTPMAERTPEQRLPLLRGHVARNPGDSQAWVDLWQDLSQAGLVAGNTTQAVRAAADRFYPNHASVLLAQAEQALLEQDWTGALNALLPLVKYHGHADATRALGRLIQESARRPPLTDALRAAYKQDARWLEPTVRAMPRSGVPTVAALPLIGLAVDGNALSPAFTRFLIRQLKTEGQWLDAHALWLRMLDRPVGLVFNGDFETAFVSDGFDWEITDNNPGRAGVRVTRKGVGERGQVLQLAFNGKALRNPVIRQHLMLSPGTYRLRGEFQSSDLHSRGGLSWVFRCAADNRELGRSEAIRAQGRGWGSVDLRVSVTADCGLPVVLALWVQESAEARGGLRGEVLFDRFVLTRP